MELSRVATSATLDIEGIFIGFQIDTAVIVSYLQEQVAIYDKVVKLQITVENQAHIKLNDKANKGDHTNID